MATSSIGVKIGFDGETEFRKEISNMNTEMKTLKTQMSLVTSEFDANDKSQENLTAQNKVLTEQIELQTQKIASLKTGLDRASDKYGEADKVTQSWKQQVNLATAELNAMNRKLEDNETAMKGATDATEKSEGGTEDFLSTLGGGAGNVAAFATVLSAELVAKGLELVATAAVDAAKEMKDFAIETEQALDKLDAALGLSTEEIEKYRNIAMELYADNFGDSVDDVATNVAKVAQQFKNLSDEEVKSITENAFILDAVFGIDIQESLRGASSMMNQFGIDSEKAFDLMTVGAQNGLNQNGDLADQIAEYSTYYADMGYSAEDMFDMMIAGAENGVYQIDYLNDAIKEFGIRTKDNSTTSSDAFTALGLDATEMFAMFAQGGEVAQEATDIVNSALFSLEDEVAKNELGVALYGTKWEDVGLDAMAAMANIQTGIGDVTGATATAGETIFDNFQSNIDTMQREIAVATYNLATGAISKSEFETIITEALNGGMDALISALPTFVDAGFDLVTGLASGLGGAAPELVPQAVVLVKQLILSLIENIPSLVDSGGDLVGGIITGLIRAIPQLILAIPELIMGLGQGIVDCNMEIMGLGDDILVGIHDGLVAGFDDLVSGFKNLLGNLVDEGKDALGIHSPSTVFSDEVGKPIVQGIAEGMDDEKDSAVQSIEDVASAVVDAATSTMDGVSVDTSDLVDVDENALAEQLALLSATTGTDTIGTIANSIAAGVEANQEIVETAADELAYTMLDEFDSLHEDFFDAGGYMVDGLWEGIANGESGLISNLVAMMERAVKAAKSALDINSPSGVFEEIGENVTAGLDIGIEDDMGNVISKMRDHMDEIATPPQNNAVTQSTNTTYSSGDTSVFVDKMYGGTDDVDTLAKKLEFTRKQKAKTKGGV